MSIVLNGTGGTITGVPGQVLQVVSVPFATNIVTTSSGLTSTGHSVTITPSSSTSKIYILNTALVSTSNPSSWGYFSTIYRGATNLATTAGGVGTPAAFAAIYAGSVSTSSTQTITMQYLDSPATTSATTYTIYIGGGGATLGYCTQGWYGSTPPAVLTAIEIAA